jgi:serine/threonine protein kinase
VESVWYEKLGEGSQFQVYKHTEVALVAKRVEVRNMVNNEETQLNDLELEIRALAEPRIYEHPNIVDLLDWGYDTVHELAPELQAAGRALLPLRVPVLYLEPANEGSLAKFLEISRDWATRVKLCLDIAAALECLHGCRIIHNDLKPDNVLIFRTDEESQIYTAKLADFGFALPSDRQKDLSFFEYGNTQAWKPPESIDYSEKMHGIYTDGLLFKSESFAYGMLALFILFSPAKSSPHPFNRDPLRRRNEITSRLESNTHLASREDMTEAWQAIETSFLVERPESRRSISPSVLQFGDSVIDVG